MTQPTANDIVAALEQHAAETGVPLPIHPSTIAMMEKLWGVSLDLETGSVATGIDADDGRQTLDDHAWLAALEAANDGRVTITWACRPEDWDFERNCPKGLA